MLLYFQLNNPIEVQVLRVTAGRPPRAGEGLQKEDLPKGTFSECVHLVGMQTASLTVIIT